MIVKITLCRRVRIDHNCIHAFEFSCIYIAILWEGDFMRTILVQLDAVHGKVTLKIFACINLDIY